MKLKPPVRSWTLLDIGCGEGKDAVFFARNGYVVSAFDIADEGLHKAKQLAAASNVKINFLRLICWIIDCKVILISFFQWRFSLYQAGAEG
ncbi:MAG: class I SAM-dependent methyltransferase [Acidaminococcaceae bacterium]|nr:class I SAM-dependent methyltransferase [Acidaminococcaceae bacterium]